VVAESLISLSVEVSPQNAKNIKNKITNFFI